MIDTRDMETMLVEITTGKPPSLNTPEANELRAKLTAEVQEILAKGGEVEIPHEIPE